MDMLKIGLCLIIIFKINDYTISASPIPPRYRPPSICELVPLPKGILLNDVVNIIYTMKSSCQLCHKQLQLLKHLRSSLLLRRIETEVTIGLNVKPEKLSGLDPQFNVNYEEVWQALGQHNGHFYIIDRCGRQAFQIPSPWSVLQFPFVQAAVLTTQYSHVCGLCPQDYHPERDENHLRKYPPIIKHIEQSPVDEGGPRIVMRHPHKHEGSEKTYFYVEMDMTNPYYHAHLSSEEVTRLRESDQNQLPLSSVAPSIIEQKDKNNHTTINQKTEEIFKKETIINNLNLTQETESVVNSSNSITENSHNVQNIIPNNSLSTKTTEGTEKYPGNKIEEAFGSKNENEINETTQSKTSERTPPPFFGEDLTESSENEDYTGDFFPVSPFKNTNNFTSDEKQEIVILREHYNKILNWVDM